MRRVKKYSYIKKNRLTPESLIYKKHFFFKVYNSKIIDILAEEKIIFKLARKSAIKKTSSGIFLYLFLYDVKSIIKFIHLIIINSFNYHCGIFDLNVR